MWGLAWTFFPKQAEGSVVELEGKGIVGSALIAQEFTQDRYFHPRPSAVSYDASAAGGSNLGSKSSDLKEKYAERARILHGAPGEPAPLDLVSASGSGLDPDIAAASARGQASRIAKARGLAVEDVRAIVDRLTQSDALALGAQSRVNVLLLNIALDRLETKE